MDTTLALYKLLTQRLSGPNSKQWFDYIMDCLCNDHPAKPKDFTVWLPFKLKVYDSTSQLEIAIANNTSARVSPDAKVFLRSSTLMLSQQEKEIDLVVVSNLNLGRPDGCGLEETINFAAERGLDPCPQDTAPQLCVVATDWLPFESLIVVSQPIDSCLFYLKRGFPGTYLEMSSGGFDHLRDGDSQFVFCRRQ